MSNNFIYCEVNPENVKDSYKEFDTIDFRVNNPGKALVKNSLRLMADVEVYSQAGVLVDGDESIIIDHEIGGHNFIDSCVTSTISQGTIETFDNYARYIKQKTNGTMVKGDFFNSSSVCELRNAIAYDIRNQLAGKKIDGALVEPCDFFIKPDICLNNVVTNNVSFMKTNEIRISFRLNRNSNVLYGEDNDSEAYYLLKNVKLSYNVVPDDPQYQGPVEMFIKSSHKQTISTTHSIIDVKTPINADSVVMSFINVNDENSYVLNKMELQRLPNVSRIEYVYNDQTNGLVSFDINNEPEMLIFTEQAYKDNGVSNFSLSKLYANKGYSIGFLFGYKQLVGNKISIAIDSDIQSDYSAYIYLNGVLSF